MSGSRRSWWRWSKVVAAAARSCPRAPRVWSAVEPLEGRQLMCVTTHTAWPEHLPAAAAALTVDYAYTGPAAAEASALVGTDIDATPPGSTADLGGGAFDVVAGGLQIDDLADAFHFSQQQHTGDFDLKVKVDAFAAADPKAKAGLMARTSLAPGSAMAFAGVTQASGYRFSSRATTGGDATATFSGGTADFATGAWVRLRRVGNALTAFHSTNGTTWTSMGSKTVALGSTVYIGLATSSKSSTATAAVQYRQLTGIATAPVQPDAPTGLAAQAASDTQINVTWNAAANATLYRILRKGPADQEFVEHATTATNAYQDKSLAANTTYYYMVRAENGPLVSAFAAGVGTAALAAPVAGALASADIGSTGGSTVVVTEGKAYDVTSTGKDIYGTADSFRFVSKSVTGNFDVSVKVTDLSSGQSKFKAGLMARESAAPGSRNVLAGLTRGAGYRFAYRSSTNGTTAQTTGGTSALNVYLRLKRSGNTFTGYRSNDGVNWTQLGSKSVTMPATIQLGLAVTGTPTAPLASASFREFGDVTVTAPPPTDLSNQIAWSKVASNPMARAEAHGQVVNDKLYVFSGFTTSDFVPRSKRSDVYDPATNQWTRIADTPVAMTHVGMAVDGHLIYVAGGVIGTDAGVKVDAVRNTWVYDTVANRWSDYVPLPEARGAGAMVRLGRELHYFGGTGTNREVSKADHFVLNLDQPQAGWTTSTPLPNPRNHLGGVAMVVNGKIYAVAGQHGHNDTQVTQADLHMWDPANPSAWTKMASLPMPLSHMGSSSFEARGRIIVVGGERANRDARSEVWEYNPQTNAWRGLTDVPVKWHSGVAGVINGALYYSTGSNNASEFQTGTWKGILPTA